MHHHRRLALVSGLLVLAIILPARAQTWRGSEAIGVQAADSKGKPIVGARVVLGFQGRGAEGTPPEVATDRKGRAVVAGLATGPWQVEVRHPDFLTYVAVFDLQRGKKPSINASFLEAGGRSLTPMKVKLSKGNPADASPPLPDREARSQAPPPAEPDRSTLEAVPTPPSVDSTRAPEATIAEEPSRQEEAKLAPAPEPLETTGAPEATIAEEPSRQEEAKSEPGPAPEVQVAAEPLEPSPAESAQAMEESALPEVQETQVPEPTPVPVPEPEQGQPPAPQQASPPTVETSEPAAPEAEPRPRPTLEAGAIAPEPESQPDLPVETVATEEAPAKLESRLEVEAVREIPEAQVPPAGEPKSIAPEPVEGEPAIEPSPGTEAAPLPQREVQVAERASPPSAPAPPASALIPDDTPTISTYSDGSCSECRIGEWAVTSTRAVAAGSVACPAEAARAARDAADGLGNSTQLELSGFVGPAADGSSSEALASAEPAISQAIQQQLAPYLGGTSNCQVVSVVLPKSVRFVGFRYEAFDAAGGGECAPGSGCVLPSARWLATPVVQRGFNATVVWGIFENTAENARRFARLKVYFRPPSARWKPPTR